MIYGLKPTSHKLPKWLRNIVRTDRFWNYGWRAYAIGYYTHGDGDRAARRSNRVYNFCVNYGKTGRLFDSRGV